MTKRRSFKPAAILARPAAALAVLTLLGAGTAFAGDDAGAWVPTADPTMESPAGEHTATVLKPDFCSEPSPPPGYPCGKVLIAGGHQTSDTGSRVAQMYDPASQSWSRVADMNTLRGQHSATLLDGPKCRGRAPSQLPSYCGAVLAAGGRSVQAYSTFEIYYPASNIWLQNAQFTFPQLALSAGHEDAAAALIDGPECHKSPAPGYCGTVIIAGDAITGAAFGGAGFNGVHRFFPETLTMVAGPLMAHAHRNTSATLLDGPACRGELPPPHCGLILVPGGINSAAELYDPELNVWLQTGPMLVPVAGHSQTLLDGPACQTASPPLFCGKVLVAGGIGNAAQLYDPLVGVWTMATPMNETFGRQGHSATVLAGPACTGQHPAAFCGKVLVAGGARTDSGIALNSAEIYDPAANGGAGSWTVTDPMAEVRYRHTATALENGTVLVAGGGDNGFRERSNTSELFDPLGNSADLSISQSSSPAPAKAGEVLTYSVSVTNSGPRTASGIIVTDTLPVAGAFSAARSDDATCSQFPRGTVTCTLNGPLASGGSATIEIDVTPLAPTAGPVVFTNTAEVTATTPDAFQHNNRSSSDTVVNSGASTPTSVLTIDDVVAAEGTGAAGARTSFYFTVSLVPPRRDEVTVEYVALNATADSAGDFDAVDELARELTFAPGESSKRVRVQVVADNVPERDEFFQVYLTNNENSVVAKQVGLGVIRDDDGGNSPPALAIEDVVQGEGSDEGQTEFRFDVTLTAPSGNQPVTVRYQTFNGTAEVGDKDYEAQGSSIQFSPGETTKTIVVKVAADDKIENHEFFQVFLMGANNAVTVKNQAIGVIVNDD